MGLLVVLSDHRVEVLRRRKSSLYQHINRIGQIIRATVSVTDLIVGDRFVNLPVSQLWWYMSRLMSS